MRLISPRALAIAFAISAALAGSSLAQEFRSADTHPVDYPTVQAVAYMGKLLAERSNNRMTIKIFPSNQLGEEKDTIEQTKIGALAINRVNMAPFNNIVPESSIPALPFVFRSTNHMRAVMDGAIGEEILKAFEPHGFIGLVYYDSGSRSFYNAKRPIRSPEDMKGLKIRVQQSDLFVALVQALGANPTPMPFGEVYTALKTGVIDGAENNWPSYESTRHFEVAKFYTINEHSLSPEVLVMSKIVWDKLAPADRDVIKKAAKDSVPHMRTLWDAREKKSRDVVVAGGSQIIEGIDKRPFQDAMKPVYEKFVTDAKMKDLVRRIQATPSS
jgi:tripartite ATP-independent transporter DctP family solute receptor